MPDGDNNNDGRSDLQRISDVLDETRTRGIGCQFVNNIECIRCEHVERRMVRVGAFYMCESCWEKEFNVDVIPLEGPLHNKYLEYLKKYLAKE